MTALSFSSPIVGEVPRAARRRGASRAHTHPSGALTRATSPTMGEEKIVRELRWSGNSHD
jgi:hypothetical protein